MADRDGNDPGKLDFARQILQADPTADAAAINRAWRVAGRAGTISQRSIGKVRAELIGTDGAPPRTALTLPAADEPRPAVPPSAHLGAARPDAVGRCQALRELEEDVDRLLFRARAIGDAPEVEEALRRARRVVVLASLPCRPRVAVVGASADRAKFGNKAVRAFLNAGFEVYPFHPSADRVEGLPAYKCLDEVPVDAFDRVSLYVPAAAGLRVLDEVARKRVGQLWLNPGADAPEVVERARALGLVVVQACSILAVGEHPERL